MTNEQKNSFYSSLVKLYKYENIRFDEEWLKRNIFKMTREEEIELLRKERIEKLNRLFKDNDM